MDLFRFPRTPHLASLTEHPLRGDKVLSPREAQELLRHNLVVEEKVDGTNVGFSVNSSGRLRAQSRGAFISPEAKAPQFKPLFPWMEARRDALIQALSTHLILFGEWCFAVHSVLYSKLPDWFLVFDVYDKRDGYFWGCERRDAMVRHLGLASVPVLGTGHFDLKGLMQLLGPSRLGEGLAEGLYLRREDSGQLVARAKLVRPEFLHSIGEHWTRRPLKTNSLAAVGVAVRESL
jgi:ATP-dependent RNA circularization protein (DNA/RNA ligase family)